MRVEMGKISPTEEPKKKLIGGCGRCPAFVVQRCGREAQYR